MFFYPSDMLQKPVLVPDYTDNADIVAATVPIDQYDAADFNINDFGYSRNDISALARAQSKEEYDMLMKRLEVLQNKGDVPKDISPVDAIKRVRSRYLQSPNELLEFASMMAADTSAKLDEAYRKSMEDIKVESPAEAPAAPAENAAEQ